MAGNFGDATAFYDLTFKIISVHVKGFERADGMKVVVRFAEKCLIISSGEEAKVDEKKSIRGASQGNRGRSRSKDSKKIESHTSNDADDEATDGSKGGQAKSKSTKELFGSLTERFVTSPRCMTEKLSKHCIKYEILSSSGDSIGWCGSRLGFCHFQSFSRFSSNRQSAIE